MDGSGGNVCGHARNSTDMGELSVMVKGRDSFQAASKDERDLIALDGDGLNYDGCGGGGYEGVRSGEFPNQSGMADSSVDSDGDGGGGVGGGGGGERGDSSDEVEALEMTDDGTICDVKLELDPDIARLVGSLVSKKCPRNCMIPSRKRVSARGTVGPIPFRCFGRTYTSFGP